MIDVDPAIEEMVALDTLRRRYGVGEHQAEALLDHFGSVEAVADARHDELLDVHGSARRQPTGSRPRALACAGSRTR